MAASPERLAQRFIEALGVDERLRDRIKRVEQRDVTLSQKDQRALGRFIRRAETEFRSLNRHVSQTFRDVAKAYPPDKRPRAFTKELMTDQIVAMFANTFTGEARLRSVVYVLRDIRYKKDFDKNKAIAKVRNMADKWFRESQLAESQAPLREALPDLMMQYLPPNIHVEVDEDGNITRMTERFRNERETLAKKIAVQKALVERYNAVAKQVKKDLKSSSERTRLAALVTSIMMETGIRPGKAGNKAVVVQGEEKVEVETFGAVTLGPSHVQIVRNGFARLEFVGKKGTINIAELSNAAVIKMLSTYVAQAKAGGSPAVFVDQEGNPFTYTNLESYMRSRFKYLRPTDFRKLRSTEVVLEALYEGQQDLYAQIKTFVAEESDDLHDRVVQAISDTISGAVLQAQQALSHDDVKTTVESYINPQVVLRFLAQGRIERTIQEAVLTAQPTLAFNVETFIEHALGDAEVRTVAASLFRTAAGGDSLLDILDDLEDDMLTEGVSVPNA